MKNEIILFENQDVKLEVNIKDETVWLTQKQMADEAHVVREMISVIENRTKHPQINTLIKILKPFGYTLSITKIEK